MKLSYILLLLSASMANAISLIPKNDHDNFYYYAVQLKRSELSSAIDSLSRPGSQNDAHLLTKRAADVASFLGYHYLGQVGELEEYHLFAHPKLSKRSHIPLSHENSLNGADEEEHHPHVLKKRLQDVSDDIIWVDQQIPKRRLFKRATILTDSDKKSLSITDPGFENQWHLENRLQVGNDINVTGVWKEGYFGKGVNVAFIDDGLDHDHPDLADNFYLEGSYDFNDHRNKPTPTLSDDTHGTRCAGEVAAKRNDVCGVGIAWETKVSGIRILSGPLTEVDEAAAINYDYQNNHIYSCSWGPPDNGRAMDAPPKIVADAFYNGIVKGRKGLGSLFVFATGNGGAVYDNCNFDGYTNSIFTITIGAIDRTNEHPKYSEECSAQMAVTYSSGQGSSIYTSDIHGRCAAGHGGTSAAAPLASGMYALVMSIRPEFTWRDFQYVTVKSALPINLDDGSWVTVAKGRKYSHRYGFGKLDAWALVHAAIDHKVVEPQVYYQSPAVQVNQPIPEGGDGVSSTFEFKQEYMAAAQMSRLEQLTVTVNIQYPRRGDISVSLTSPNGYVSILATTRPYDDNANGFKAWTFMSVKHWEENPVGVWTINVKDNDHPDLTGTFVSWHITLYGEAVKGATVDKPVDPAKQTPNASPIDSKPSSVPASPNQGNPSKNTSENDDASSSGYFGFAVMGLLSVVGIVGYVQYRKQKTKNTEQTRDYEFEVLYHDDNSLSDVFYEEEDDGMHDLEQGLAKRDASRANDHKSSSPATMMQIGGQQHKPSDSQAQLFSMEDDEFSDD